MAGIEKSQNNQIQKVEQISLEDALDRYENEYGTEAVGQYFNTIANGRSKINEDEFDEDALVILQRSLVQDKSKLANKKVSAPVNLDFGSRKNTVDSVMQTRVAQKLEGNQSKADAMATKVEDALVAIDLKIQAQKLQGFYRAAVAEMIGTDRDLIEAAQQPIDDPLLSSLVGNFEEDLLALAVGA